MLYDLAKYLKNAEWELVGIPAARNTMKYKCCSELYPDVTYTVIVKRRSLFYLCNLIFPMTIIGMLTMLSFLLPAESGLQMFDISVPVIQTQLLAFYTCVKVRKVAMYFTATTEVAFLLDIFPFLSS